MQVLVLTVAYQLFLILTSDRLNHIPFTNEGGSTLVRYNSAGAPLRLRKEKVQANDPFKQERNTRRYGKSSAPPSLLVCLPTNQYLFPVWRSILVLRLKIKYLPLRWADHQLRQSPASEGMCLISHASTFVVEVPAPYLVRVKFAYAFLRFSC